jgi:predicted DNA-binding transcriptional regulator AlpA
MQIVTVALHDLQVMIDRAADKVIKAVSVSDQKSKSTPISRRELMNRLNISEPTVIRLEKKGKIPCMHIGSAVRYDWDAVIEALESKKKSGGSQK